MEFRLGVDREVAVLDDVDALLEVGDTMGRDVDAAAVDAGGERRGGVLHLLVGGGAGAGDRGHRQVIGARRIGDRVLHPLAVELRIGREAGAGPAAAGGEGGRIGLGAAPGADGGGRMVRIGVHRAGGHELGIALEVDRFLLGRVHRQQAEIGILGEAHGRGHVQVDIPALRLAFLIGEIAVSRFGTEIIQSVEDVDEGSLYLRIHLDLDRVGASGYRRCTNHLYVGDLGD